MARRAAGRGSRLWRDALIESVRWRLATFPSEAGRERLEALERGEGVECTGDDLFVGLRRIGAHEAELFAWARNRRHLTFTLGSDDLLTEITPVQRVQ